MFEIFGKFLLCNSIVCKNLIPFRIQVIASVHNILFWMYEFPGLKNIWSSSLCFTFSKQNKNKCPARNCKGYRQ
jgi:hypothetical protein